MSNAIVGWWRRRRSRSHQQGAAKPSGFEAAAHPEQVYLHPSTVQIRAANAAARRLAWRRAGTKDVASWQDDARTCLARITGYGRYGGPPAILRRREVAANGPFAQFDLVLRVRDGHDLPLRVLLPDPCPNGPIPVMICLQDRATGMQVSWGESHSPKDSAAVAGGFDFAAQSALRGYAAVCIELPGVGIRREPEGGRSDAEDLVCALYAGRCPLADAASEVSVVVNWLLLGQTGFDVAAGRIFVVGRGFGGGAAVLAAALDDRMAGVVAVNCLAPVRELVKMAPPPLDFVLPGLLHWMDMEDVVALCAPRPFLAVAARHEPVWPVSRAVQVVEGARQVYAALGASKRIATIPAPDNQGFDSDAVWREFERLQHAEVEPAPL
jgi:hypothetical protein